ncbi:MAG TPA: glycogen synthase [Kofleriaceae bacterium]|nr:glycogen synthase [Kofleriaceae bacterium]
MNILFLSREYPPAIYGGGGVAVDHLSRALARRAQVEVRCFGEGERSNQGVRVRAYPAWDRLAGGPEAPYAPALEAFSVGLAMARDAAAPDVVHAHTWYVGLAGLLIGALSGAPLVVTMHSLEPLRPWKADQLGAGYALSTWAERVAVEQADRIIAVSEEMRTDVLAHFRVDPARVVVIHNGVDAEAYRPTDRRDALARHGIEAPYVLFVGRISEQKGIFQLLEAAASLPDGVALVLCASSPDTPELKARLSAAVASLPRVRWIDQMLPVDQLVQLYSHAAVFACPSIYEPFGLINLEAMACSTPVVATRVGGIPEVVVDGETGWLVPPGDPAALAGALRGALADPQRAARFGAAGRRRVEQRFSWHRIAELTMGVYGDAIQARASR